MTTAYHGREPLLKSPVNDAYTYHLPPGATGTKGRVRFPHITLSVCEASCTDHSPPTTISTDLLIWLDRLSVIVIVALPDWVRERTGGAAMIIWRGTAGSTRTTVDTVVDHKRNVRVSVPALRLGYKYTRIDDPLIITPSLGVKVEAVNDPDAVTNSVGIISPGNKS